MTSIPLTAESTSANSSVGTDQEFVFIVGCARSGTTLLSDVLRQHGDVFIAPETKYFQRVWSQRHLLRLSPSLRRERAIVNCLVASEYSSVGPVFEKHARDFKRVIREHKDLREIFFAMLQQLSPAHLIGEKTPWHTFFVKELLAARPSAKILAICRDAPAVVASLLRRDGFRRVQTINQCVARWMLANKEILRIRQRLHPAQFMLIRFEDLVADSRNSIERLCGWLGIEPQNSMFAPPAQDSSLRPSSERTGAPGFDTGVLTRWKSCITSSEVERIEALTQRLATVLGYERRENDVPFAARCELAVERGLQACGVKLMRSGLYPFGALAYTHANTIE